jgi:predicted cation transporter
MVEIAGQVVIMLRQSVSELYRVALMVTGLVVPLLGAFVRRSESWFNIKLASELHKIPLKNVILTMIIVVLGLSTTLITPILPLFLLGAIAFFLPFGRRATIKFVIIGALSIGLGAFATVDLPLSLLTTMRLEGPLFTTTYLEILNLYSIFGIAAIGILSLFFLKADCESGGTTWN